MQRRPFPRHGARTALDNSGQLGVKRVREADVADQAPFEKGKGPHALGAVNDLVGQDKVHGADLLAQRADGAEGQDAAHAQVPQGGDVGARGHLVRRELVVAPVAREEGDGHAVVLENLQGRRGVAPRRERVDRRDGVVAFNLGEAGAANDGDVDGPWKQYGRGTWSADEGGGRGGGGAG